MGNCCGGEDAVSSQPARGAFRGEGHRLGSTNEATPLSNPSPAPGKIDEDVPKPIHDPTLTGLDREQQRKERLAAAEARQKKAGGPAKKKKEYKDVPLSGPNSKPTMTWTSG